MISAIKVFFARRRLKKMLARHMGAEAAETILTTEVLGNLKDREFCFLLLEFKATDRAMLEIALSSVVDVVATHNGMLDTMVSNLVIVYFGALDWSPLAGYRAFIQAVLETYGADVRIAYSVGKGHIGNIGSRRRMSFSFIHPAFPRTLVELSNMPFGEAHEIV